MIFFNTKLNEGYIALISAIIISILLITITLGLSFNGFFSRFNVLDSEFKTRGINLAEGCAEIAISKAIVGSDMNSSTSDCSIVRSNFTTTGAIIETQSIINNKIYTNLRIEISTSTNTLTHPNFWRIESWQEVPRL